MIMLFKEIYVKVKFIPKEKSRVLEILEYKKKISGARM